MTSASLLSIKSGPIPLRLQPSSDPVDVLDPTRKHMLESVAQPVGRGGVSGLSPPQGALILLKFILPLSENSGKSVMSGLHVSRSNNNIAVCCQHNVLDNE